MLQSEVAFSKIKDFLFEKDRGRENYSVMQEIKKKAFLLLFEAFPTVSFGKYSFGVQIFTSVVFKQLFGSKEFTKLTTRNYIRKTNK